MEALSESLTHLEAQEESVLAQLDQALASEAQIKRTQLSMLLRIRGILTPEQLGKAMEKAEEIRLGSQSGFALLGGYGGYGIQRRQLEFQRELQKHRRQLQQAQKKLRELQ